MSHQRLSRALRSSVRMLFAFASAVIACSQATAAPGHLVWDDSVPTSGGDAEVVAARDGKVFAAGLIPDYTAGRFVAIRAYDARTGALLWSDQLSGTDNDEVKGIHAFENVLAVCGIFNGFHFSVVAYDADTGRRLWVDESAEGFVNACDGAGGTLFAVGGIVGASTGVDFAVRAYDARTGTLLSESRYDGGGQVADYADAVTVRDGKVYVTGDIQQTSGDDDMLLRRYDAGTGALDWQQIFAGPVGGRDEGVAIAVGPSRVFVGGFASHVAGETEWAVLAFRADSGAPVWTDFRAGEELHDIAVRRGRVVAGGQNSTDVNGAVVRAYDAGTGTVLWDQRAANNFTDVEAIDTDDDFAYWTGNTRESSSSTPPPSLIVRAVDLDTGATAWESVLDAAWGRDVVVQDRHVFVGGFTTGSFGQTNGYLVRAYR